MPDRPKRLYWDACCFLAYINEIPNRLPHVEALLEAARRGEIQIITSVLSIGEVAAAATEIDALALDPEVEAKIDLLWELGSPIQLVEAHQLTAEEARKLRRDFIPMGWTGLRSMDAIHLATAKLEGVDEINTYDGKWTRYAPHIGRPIKEPEADQPNLGLR